MCNLSSALSYLLKSMFISLMTLILFKFLCCSFMTKKKKNKKKKKTNKQKKQKKKQKKNNNSKFSKFSKNLNTLFFFFFFFLFLQNAFKCNCSSNTYVVEVGPEHLYLAMMDSLRQQTKGEISRPRQKKSLTAVGIDTLVPCVRMFYHR